MKRKKGRCNLSDAASGGAVHDSHVDWLVTRRHKATLDHAGSLSFANAYFMTAKGECLIHLIRNVH